MKQFTMLGHFTGDTYGPITLADAVEQAGPNGYAILNGLSVGSSWSDPDGDTWTRTDDSATEGVVTRQRRDERLERIATAAMAAIIGKLPLTVKDPEDTEGDEMTARGAIKYAKALIAELDKQA